MDSWTGAQRAFAAQREFRKKFGIHRNSKSAVSSCHTDVGKQL
jgi:hypothetical protein